jgi:hypothetical protein
MFEGDEIAFDADERRRAIGELDRLNLDRAQAATKKSTHRGSI